MTTMHLEMLIKRKYMAVYSIKMYKNTNTMPFCIFVLGIKVLPINKSKILHAFKS